MSDIKAYKNTISASFKLVKKYKLELWLSLPYNLHFLFRRKVMALADLERDGHGYLVDLNTWSEDVAVEFAAEEGLELDDLSFKVINFLRDEYINNNANQPNERNIVKGLKGDWPSALSTKDLYALFPKGPAKQAGKIAGLPETKRKGGY